MVDAQLGHPSMPTRLDKVKLLDSIEKKKQATTTDFQNNTPFIKKLSCMTTKAGDIMQKAQG